MSEMGDERRSFRLRWVARQCYKFVYTELPPFLHTTRRAWHAPARPGPGMLTERRSARHGGPFGGVSPFYEHITSCRRPSKLSPSPAALLLTCRTHAES